MRIILLLAFLVYQGLFGQCTYVNLPDKPTNHPQIIINNPNLTAMSSLDYQKLYQIYRVRDNSISRIPVSCRYGLNKNGFLVIEPKKSLANGLEFTIKSIEGKDTCWTKFSTPKKEIHANNSQKVNLEMFPKTENIPLNILCFHIKFSEAMEPKKDAFRFVEVYDDKGDKIFNMWRNRTYWLKNNTVMVLMVHPARVKRGIDLDIPFKEKKEYKIILQEGLKSKTGIELPKQELKNFKAINPDYSLPQFLYFDSLLPKSQTRQSLKFYFSEGMDYSSIRDGVTIQMNDEFVKGEIKILNSDDAFEFKPSKSWKSGKYQLLLHNKVSDFSANGLNSPFEEKLDQQYPHKNKTETRSFEIK